MFRITYSFAQTTGTTNNPRSIDEFALRYSLFNGSVNMRTEDNGVNIAMSWEWIPLLDFALSLRYIMSIFQINCIKRERFEFTESDSTILFAKHGNIINITASFSAESIVISDRDFYKGVTDFFNQLKHDIEGIYPEIRKNVIYKQLVQDYSV